MNTDQLNENSINGEDSIEQIKEILGKREFYISGTGNFLYDPISESMAFTLQAMTGGMD